MKGKICLIVDNPARDLDGMTLVAERLAKSGYDAYMVPFYQSYEVYFINPDMVVVNYIRPNNLEFVALCRQMDIAIAVLDTEGAIVQDIEAHFRNIARSIKNNIDLYLVWGPAQAEALSKTTALPESKIKVTGAPRYDLCHSSLRHCLRKITLESFDKIVLINTNHPILFPRFQSVEKEKWNLVNLVGWAPDFVDEWMVQSKIAADSTVETARKLAQKFQDICFVLRPHPFEDSSVYSNQFEGLKNVRVIQEGNVFDWINSSEVLVHRNCSTAIEAVLMGKEALNMRWPSLPHIVQPVPEKISISVFSFDEITAQITDILQGKSLKVNADVLENRESLIARFFFKHDGKNSLRVAEEISVCLTALRVQKKNQSSAIAVISKLIRNGQHKEVIRVLLIALLGYKGFVKFKALFKKNRYDFSKEFGASQVEDFLIRLANGNRRTARAKQSGTGAFNSYSVLVSEEL